MGRVRVAKERPYSETELKSGVAIRIETDAHLKAVRLSQRHKMSMKAIINYLIDVCEEFDLLKKGWQNRINAAIETGGRVIDQKTFMQLDEACAALCFIDEKWKCVWGNEDAPPSIKMLAEELDEALAGCGSCGKTLRLKMKSVEDEIRISDLETQLIAERERMQNQITRYRMPVCALGGNPNADATGFTSCRVRGGQPVSIEGFCKIRRNGLPCNLYSERVIAAGVENVSED